MSLEKASLAQQYRDLASHPAWLDLVDNEKLMIEKNKQKFFNNEKMEDDEKELLRLKIIHNQKLLNSMIARINTMSVKEQK